MSNKQFITALGICVSLSSTMAAAETATVTQANAENSAIVDTAQNPTVAPANINTINSESKTADSEKKPTLIHRSLNKIGEISNQSIEEIGALGSKIAVNANAAQPASVKDPFEHFNRKIYAFNMKLDKYILLPVSRVYKNITPTPVQHGVTQFFRNLSTPWTAVNNLLQGHPGTSIESLSRFVINTTTTLGFYDVAGALGVERSDEDFGQTLGVWGIGSGPYVMLPFFGPSTVRDTFGRAVDQFGAPQSYLKDTWEKVGITGLKYVSLRARVIGLENIVQGDPYTLLRDIYLQDRQFKSNDSGSDDAAPSNQPSNFGDDGFGDNDFSQNSNSPVTSTTQVSTDTTQNSSIPLSSATDITADTPIDPSATVTLAQTTQF